MAKRFTQLTQLTAAQLARDDILVIRDTSTGQVKYITVADLTGSPEFGWTATGESWTYLSYNATTFIGVVTVPSDATAKYGKGMRVRIVQTTGGTKYAKVVGVTSTTLTLYFLNSAVLNNEAITSPVYSLVLAPTAPSTVDFEKPEGSSGHLRFGDIVISWGTVTTAAVGTAAYAEASTGVTFPVTYSAVPIVTATMSDLTGSVGEYLARGTTTTTQAYFWTGHTAAMGAATATIINWIAIGTVASR